MLFPMVLLEFLDDISDVPGIDLQLWYLDVGTFVGDRDCISSLLELFLAKVLDSVFTSIWINARFIGHQRTIRSLNFLLKLIGLLLDWNCSVHQSMDQIFSFKIRSLSE